MFIKQSILFLSGLQPQTHLQGWPGKAEEEGIIGNGAVHFFWQSTRHDELHWNKQPGNLPTKASPCAHGFCSP